MGARVYNPETNQFTSKDPIKGGNENPYTYPSDPVNGNDFSGLWSWEDTLDVALTVASFLPIPGVQQVAWIGKGALIAYKVSSMVSKVTRSTRMVSAGSKPLPKIAGVYEYKVKKKWYVGETNDIARRMSEHARSWPNDKITKIRYKTMPGKTKFERREFEQLRIDDRGGVPKLHNRRNAIRKVD